MKKILKDFVRVSSALDFGIKENGAKMRFVGGDRQRIANKEALSTFIFFLPGKQIFPCAFLRLSLGTLLDLAASRTRLCTPARPRYFYDKTESNLMFSFHLIILMT